MTDNPSPYRGLTPYTEADAAYFFGRTAESANLAANLEVTRLTILYGPSGVGKSSVLRAGVIHTLQQHAQENVATGGRPEIIPIYFNRWQSEPLEGLTQAINAAGQPYLPNGDALTPDSALRIPHSELITLLATLSAQTDSELLIILDQFEEYFLYHADEQGPDSFARQFVQAVNRPDLRVNFLLSLREDALGRLDTFKGQIPFLLDNRLSIEHLNRAAGQEAVTRPLEQYNADHNTHYTIEPALVETVLDQIGRGKVALSKQGASVSEAERGRIEAPYLQLVLTRLWEQEQATGSTLLRQATLDTLGGAESIVSNYLNDTMAGLPNADQAVAAHLFDRLVTLGGAKIALTLVELAYYADADVATVQPLVQQLEQRRLLRSVQSSTGVTQYEIFHDVLGQALLDWQTRYQEAQAEATRLAEEQAARVAAEQRAAAERRNSTRLRWLLGIMIVLLAAAAVATVVALSAQKIATAAQTMAEERRVEAETEKNTANEARKTAEAEKTHALQAEKIAQANSDLANQQLARLEGLRLLQDAEKLKMEGKVDDAIATYAKAVKADLSLKIDLTEQGKDVRRQAAILRVHEGEKLARNGDLTDAAAKYQAALDLNPPLDTPVYVHIPAGEFIMGSDPTIDKNANANQEPQHKVMVQEFWILRTEVTNAQYGECVQAKACEAPANTHWDNPQLRDQPVSSISWQQAVSYTKWMGGRLPTEAEWEKACRGIDGRLYPWGNKPPTPQLANVNLYEGTLIGVGSYPDGKSPYGLLDMIGNVWEWTSSKFRDYPYKADDGREEVPSPEELTRDDILTLRGGAFLNTGVRCAFRGKFVYGWWDLVVGFRVISPGF